MMQKENVLDMNAC